MGPTVFALVILASGYLFLRKWRITRALVIRSDGHALYFSVVIASLAVFFDADLIRSQIATSPWPIYEVGLKLTKILTSFATEPKYITLGQTSIWSVVVAVAAFSLLNRPIARCESLRIRLYMRASCLAELEEFLLVTTSRHMPVMVTIDTGKVYVGYSIGTPDGRDVSDWIKLEPLMSGYRDEKHEFVHTTDYRWMHSDGARNGRDRSEFDIIIPTSEIVSVHAFDITVYAASFGEDRPSPPASVAHVSRSGSLPRSKAERHYWAYVSLVAAAPMASYLFGLAGLVGSVVLVVLLGRSSALDEST